MKVAGSVAAVFGAARGLGKAYSRALLHKGAKVVFGDVLVDAGKVTAEELNREFGDGSATFSPCDISQQDQVHSLLQLAKAKHGQLDIVVNNAGVMNEFQWEKTMDVNFGGSVRCTLAGLEYMGKDKGGSGGVIVHTASVHGLYPNYYAPMYSACKHAMIAYSRSWVEPQNFVNHGVRINLICPISVDTDMLGDIQPDKVYHAHQKQQHLKSAYKLTTSEVADVLIDIIEDNNMNGQAVKVMSYGTFPHEFQPTPTKW